MTIKTFSAIERRPTSIPIQYILSDNGSPNIFPEVMSKGYFDIDFRRDELVLVAGKYIGLIPINDKVAINVQPKVGITSLVNIISKSREYIDSLHFFERYYQETSASSPTIFEFFANCLNIELRKLEREGVYKQYLSREENFSSPKGRIDIGKTITRNWSKGLFNKAHCIYHEFTSDNHFNRMIKYTIWYCLNHLSRIGSVNIHLIKDLSYYYNYFDSIPIDKNRSFLPAVISDIHLNKLPVLRFYYENICKICRCIIEDIGIMLKSTGEDIKMLSFIVNMENIFEKYLLNLLRDSVTELGPNTYVLDGNKEGKSYLFNDSKKYEAKPDILLKREHDIKLIVDAKYKVKSSEADRYQVISHALSFGAPIAVLIMPLSNKSTPGLSKIGTIGKSYSIELYEYYIDLENVDLSSVEDQYILDLKDLCNAA